MLAHRYALPCFVLASSLLVACVMTNPGWDPPIADGQTETGSADEADTDEWEESGFEMSSEGDEIPFDDDDDDDHNPGDGDGDLGDGDGDGDEGDGDEGDGDEGDGDGGDGDGDGDNLVCGQASASFGPCPAGCDECQNGICWRYCGAGECQDDFLLCPVSWSCHLLCLGKDSCRDATVACTGWGECTVECMGNTACAQADIMCAGGPCNVTCGAGYDKPCERLDVRCGSNVTKLECKDPYKGEGPELTHEEFAQCECSNNCVPE